MATIDSKEIIDDIIASDGYYEGDPRVYMIVEYTNFEGRQTWGVTWVNEHPSSKLRYLQETEYVRSPKVIWQAKDNSI